MSDDKRLRDSLRKLAELKVQEYSPVLEDQAGEALRRLDIDEDTAAKTAATLKILGDLSQGELGFDSNGFDVRTKFKPEEKSFKVGYKKRF